MGRRDLSHVDRYAAAAAPGRQDAVDRLTTFGFPGFKDEDWFYTPTRRLLAEPFVPVVGAARAADVALPEGQRLVFVDGLFDAASSTLVLHDQRVSVDPTGTGELLTEPLGFDALNAALWRDGAQLTLTGGDPIHLVHVATGDSRLGVVRHRVHVPAGAEATLVESHLGRTGDHGGRALTSDVVEITIEAGATLHHVLLQEAHPQAAVVHTVLAKVASDATYQATSLQLGGALARAELRVELAGEGSRTDLAGLALGTAEEHLDHQILIDHAVPHGTSTQSFRSILDGEARSVFTGKVIVREGAMGTDSDQSNRNLLLSDDAVANTRPQLEIYADDVTCAHGATIGKLDDDAMFYLRQRGLDPKQARGLLVEAFAAEVVATIADEAVREVVQARVAHHVQATVEGQR
jgi:Fe-S cluster assembly protein SufD